MGQHKFEEQIRRQLSNRKINPSPDAWKELNERLEKENKKSKSFYWIAGIAASFAAGILIVSFHFNYNIIESSPTIVDTQVEPDENVKDDNFVEVKADKEKDLNPGMEQIAAEKNKGPEAEKVKEPMVAPVVADVFKQQVASAGKIQGIQKDNETEVYKTKREEILPKKLEEILAEVSSESNERGGMTNLEVDALLYKAAAEISMEKDREKFSGRVDATALLRDVEMELDQNFREKVFDLLKEGYLKARTAVANRNF